MEDFASGFKPSLFEFQADLFNRFQTVGMNCLLYTSDAADE